MKNLSLIIDAFNKKIGHAVSWLSLLLVIVVCYDVVVRYVFKESSVALQELEWHLFAIIFMAAAGYTLLVDEHVRVDVIYTRFSFKTQAWINFFGSLIFLIPFCAVIIISSYDFVVNSFLNSETSPDAGGLPARYLLKALIPVSLFLLLIQGISQAIKSFFILKEKTSQPGE